jgi:peptide/nickel transport system substrate-binding protein
MDERNYWSRMMGSRISRRGALRGAGIGAAGLAGAALIGCGDDDDDDDDDGGGGGGGTATATTQPTASPTADPNAVKRGGTFRQATITVAPHYSTLHPGADPSYINTFRRQGYYRRLWYNNGGLGLTPDQLITMDLAESIERPTDTEVIVKVKNAPWQNQPKSDSNDVVAQRDYDALDTVERLKFMQAVADTNASVNTFITQDLASVEAIDDQTIKFTTNAPSAFFTEESNGVMFRGLEVPREMLDEEILKTHVPIGNGPYMFDNGQSGSFEHAVPNPTYQDPEGLSRPYLDRRELTFVPDAVARETAFRANQIDQTWFEDVRQADTVERDLGDKIERIAYPQTSGQALILNIRRRPWQDERARRAVHLGINVQRVIDTVWFGDGMRAWYFADANSIRTPITYEGVKDIIYYDPAEAAKLVAAVKADGNYNDEELSMFLPVEAQTWVDAGTLEIEDLNEIGLNVFAEPLPRNIYLARSGNKPHDDPNGSSDFDITMTVYLAYHHATSQTASFWNNGALEDAEIDDIVVQINQTLDAEARAELSHQFERLLAEKAANFVPLLTGNSHVGYYSYVKGANFMAAIDGISGEHQNDLWLDA